MNLVALQVVIITKKTYILEWTNVFNKMVKANTRYAYLSTQDNISGYRINDKPKFFPDGEIILYVPTEYITIAQAGEIHRSQGGSTGSGMNAAKPLTMQTFPSFKRTRLRWGYLPGYTMNDDFSNKFNQVFTTHYGASYVSSENLGTVVNDNVSFLTMRITTHNINGTDVKFARASGAIFQYRDNELGMILMSKKLNNQ